MSTRKRSRSLKGLFLHPRSPRLVVAVPGPRSAGAGRSAILGIRLTLALLIIGLEPSAEANHLSPTLASGTERALGYGNMKVNGRPALGERPLVVTMVEFDESPDPAVTDDKFPGDRRALYDYLFFGAGSPPSGAYTPTDGSARNVRGYYKEVSHGLFNWRKAGLLGPYTYPNDPRTTADERQKACVMTPASCPGVGLVNFKTSNPAFLLTVPGGGGESTSVVAATASRPEAYEGFTLVDRNSGELENNDEIELITYSNHYVALEPGRLVANRSESGKATRFRIVKQPGASAGSRIANNDPVALRNGTTYVKAENGGGSAVTTVGWAREWETFTFVEAPHDGARHRRTAMELAAANGFNFAYFDSASGGGDGDGTVEFNELAFVRILSHVSQEAQASALPRPALLPNWSIQVHPAVVGADAGVNFPTIVHELAHTLGGFDLYGALEDLNSRLTLMTGTKGTNPNGSFERDSFHLDPWHKMQLGWLRPDVRSLDTTQQDCRRIAPARFAGAPTADELEDRQKPFLFYRPSRAGTNEMYLLEYRTKAKLGGGDADYDADVANEGMALWLAQTQPDSSGIPKPTKVPGGRITGGGQNGSLVTSPAGDDQANSAGTSILRGPNQRLDTAPVRPDTALEDRAVVAATRQTSPPPTVSSGTWGNGQLVWGGNQLWSSNAGVIRPVWVDGSSTGLEIRVGPLDQLTPLSGLEVEWSANRTYRPRITGLSTTAGSVGNSVRVEGELGVSTGKAVYFVNGTRWTRAPIRSWGCTAGAVAVPDVPPGEYQIVVMSGATASNAVRFTVRPAAAK